MDIQYSFRLPAETLEGLRVVAAKRDLSIAQLLRKVSADLVEQLRREERGLDNAPHKDT